MGTTTTSADAALAAATDQVEAALSAAAANEAALQARLAAEQQAHAETQAQLAALQAAQAAPPPPAAVFASDASGTVTVGYRGASGVAISLSTGRVLNGRGAGSAPYGVTRGVPAAAFEEWLSANATAAIVKSGSLIVLSRQP